MFVLWLRTCVFVWEFAGSDAGKATGDVKRNERERKKEKIVKEREDFKERKKITFEIILSSFSLQFPHFSNAGLIPLAHYET